jgi:hypothetical protein
MKISTRSLGHAVCAAVLASSAALTACGGSGGTDDVTGAAGAIDGPKFACVNVVGAADTAQSALITQVIPQLAAIPEAGPLVQNLVRAVSELLDVVDSIVGGLQDMAATRDPMALNVAVENSVATLRCALTPISQALAGLPVQLPAGTSIPQIDSAQAVIAQIAALLDTKLGSGPGAGLPTGLDLGQLEGLMQQLNTQLNSIALQLAAKLPAGTPVSPVFNIIAISLVNVTRVFDRVAALDGVGVADSVMFIITDMQARLTSTLAGQMGLPLTGLVGTNNGLNTLTSALATFPVTALVLVQLRNALLTVLGPLLGLLGL